MFMENYLFSSNQILGFFSLIFSYEKAIAVVISKFANAIVVDSFETGKQCLAYFKQARIEHVVFIPLDSIAVKPIDDGLRRLARLAVDCCEFSHVVEKAVLFACGNTLVVDDQDAARHLAYTVRVNAKIVCLDGTVFHKGG